MALASIEDHTKEKMASGFATRKTENGEPSKLSPIPEASMLKKMAEVWQAPPAGLKEKRACMTPILDRTIAGKEKQW